MIVVLNVFMDWRVASLHIGQSLRCRSPKRPIMACPISQTFLFPNLAPSPARRGKKKRAFDAFRLWHRQAPWEESKPKARPWSAVHVHSSSRFELGGFSEQKRFFSDVVVEPKSDNNYSTKVPRRPQGRLPACERASPHHRFPEVQFPPFAPYCHFFRKSDTGREKNI